MNTDIKLKELSGNFYYHDRKSRYEFLVKEFGGIISGDLLDVGCDNKYLREILNGKINYTGIDLNESADIIMDLEKDSLLSLHKTFDTIICTDVLEHIESIHRVFDEIIEIAQKYIVVSLPNAWFDFKKIPVMKNSGKFYGLPVSVPLDRHRWFFNFTEAMDFIESNAKGKVKEINFYPYFHKSNRLIKLIAKSILSANQYYNLFSPTLWAVLKK